MTNDMITQNFTKSAKDLAKNPLGIIALFIVLVYSFACLLFGFSAEKLIHEEKMPIIYFVIFFPIAILGLFGWLVAKHHNKLYAPSDFKDDNSFLQTVNQTNLSFTTINTIKKEDIEDLLNYGADFEIVAENENTIKALLKSRNITNNFEDTVIKLLIRQLAASQGLVWFEKTYNLIFGSQLELLLKGLNHTDFIIDKDFIENIFQKTKEFNNEILKDWNLENYLNFLYASELIVEKNKIVYLTQRGNEFLKMMNNSNYSKNKIL